MLRRMRRTVKRGPLLSVVVPVHLVEEHLDACLTSIREQHYRPIEIVVVDDGSPDDSMAIARRHATRDRRIRIVERPNGGLSAARNTGVAAATGDFLTFVDSDDLVTPDGLAAAMASLARTGSDVAVLRYGRLRDGRPVPGAPWIRALHAETRERITLDDRPDVMVNATAWGKVFRREFYDRVGLGFVEGVIYEDQDFTATAYAAARSIDVLDTTGYLWRVNDSSLSQGQVTVANLRGRLDAADRTLAALAAHPRARSERALQQLRFNLPNSLLKLERADDDYLALLIERVPVLLDEAPPDRVAAEVPAEFRVLYRLLRGGDTDAVWRFVRAEGMQAEVHPAAAEPAGYTVHLPGWGDDPVPPEDYVLTAEQTAPRFRVHAVSRDGADLRLELQAWVPNVDFDEHPPAVTLDADFVTQVAEGAAPHVFTSRIGTERTYARSGWTVTVLDAARRTPFDLRVRLDAGPFGGHGTVRVRL